MRKHPIVEFTRFLVLILIACLTHDPLTLTVLLSGSFFLLENFGKKQFLGELGLILFISIFNALTNHRGVTCLFYLKDNQVTAESFFYGFLSGIQVIVLFRSCMAMSRMMTGEKMTILTSSLSPSLGILISMSIRSLSRYKEKLQEIYGFQRAENEPEDLYDRIYIGIRTIQILTGWALENGMETSDSMKCRGYGTRRRTSYLPVHFGKTDAAELSLLVLIFILERMWNPETLLLPEICLDFEWKHFLLIAGLMIYEGMEYRNESRDQKERAEI